MKRFLCAAAFLIGATPAMADIIEIEAKGSVSEVTDALSAAVEGAGAKVFARVDHAGGAEKVGESLAPAELLIFGNPKLGTPAMQADPHAGIVLPLRVLVYENAAGKTVLAYQDVDALFADMNVPADHPVRAKMAGALAKLTAEAAE